MRTMMGFIGATAGSALGWWAGAGVGIMTATMLSAVGTGVGIYAAMRFTREYLE